MNWNWQWEQFFNMYPKARADQILDFLDALQDAFGLE